MKPHVYFFISVIVPLGLLAEGASDILPPQKRTTSVELARTLLAISPIEFVEEELLAMNPFNPPQPVQTVDSTASTSAVLTSQNDKDLLKILAESVTPSGTIQFAGQQLLLFGPKKFKVGDLISVTYQGANYELVIAAIERSSFTLRLKKEQVTQPIKAPVKKS